MKTQVLIQEGSLLEASANKLTNKKAGKEVTMQRREKWLETEKRGTTGM